MTAQFTDLVRIDGIDYCIAGICGEGLFEPKEHGLPAVSHYQIAGRQIAIWEEGPYWEGEYETFVRVDDYCFSIGMPLDSLITCAAFVAILYMLIGGIHLYCWRCRTSTERDIWLIIACLFACTLLHALCSALSIFFVVQAYKQHGDVILLALATPLSLAGMATAGLVCARGLRCRRADFFLPCIVVLALSMPVGAVGLCLLLRANLDGVFSERLSGSP